MREPPCRRLFELAEREEQPCSLTLKVERNRVGRQSAPSLASLTAAYLALTPGYCIVLQCKLIHEVWVCAESSFWATPFVRPVDASRRVLRDHGPQTTGSAARAKRRRWGTPPKAEANARRRA
jgi:hypothetical protein